MEHVAWDELLRMEGQIRKRRQKEIYDRKIFREKVIGMGWHLWSFLLLVLLFRWSFRLLSRGGGQRMVGIELAETNASEKKVDRKHLNGFVSDGKVIYLVKSDNIKNCYTCFLKKFSDWTWARNKKGY